MSVNFDLLKSRTSELKREPSSPLNRSAEIINTPLVPAHRLMNSIDNTVPRLRSMETLPKLRQSLRDVTSHSDPPSVRSLNDSGKENLGIHLSISTPIKSQMPLSPSVSDWKNEYRTQMTEAAEKYLIDDIIKLTSPSEMHVVAYILWKSLVHWGAFKNNESFYTRIFSECRSVVKNCSDSKTMLVQWLSTTISLNCLVNDEIKLKDSMKEDCGREQIFKVDISNLGDSIFESLCKLFQKRIDPLLEDYLEDIQDDASIDRTILNTKLFNDIYRHCYEFIDVISQQCIFESIPQLFFSRIICYITNVMIQNCSTQGGSFGKATQIKLFLTQIEEWSRSKYGSKYSKLAQKYFEPLRQVTNILIIPEKQQLESTSFRTAICPLLQTNLITQLLQNFQPDAYIREPIPQYLITTLSQQTQQTGEETYNVSNIPHLDLSSLEHKNIDWDTISLPKAVMDRSGFSFLTPVKSMINTHSTVW